VKAPPSRASWAIEGELRRHTPTEVIAYLSACADYEDAQVRRRAMPADFALATDVEPRAISVLRRLFGRWAPCVKVSRIARKSKAARANTPDR
jgi:hypothetical protein